MASNGRLASDRLLRLLVWKVPGNCAGDNLTALHTLGPRLLRQALGSRAEATRARKTSMEGEQDAWQQLSVSTCPE